MKKILIFLMSFFVATPLMAKETLNGAGASFPYPIYSGWAYSYEKEKGVRVNYQSIGSGGGIKQIIAGTVDFGASDDPLSRQELDKNSLLQFPAITGGIVIIINIKGIKEKITLDGPTLADIFMGKITMWNDPKIVALNKNIGLPPEKITVIRRSDSSGTTAVFTKYLSEVSNTWQKEIGSGKAVNWKIGIGAKGNDGLTKMVTQTINSIGYTEYSYAEQSGLNYTNLVNQYGNIVSANIYSFKKAVSSINWHEKESYGVSLTNSKNKEAWPIMAASFILIRKDKREVQEKVMDFFKYAFEKGDASAEYLKYVPISKELKDEILSGVK